MFQSVQAAAIVFVLLAGGPRSSAGPSIRTTLKDAAEVHHDVIRLSDLLPSSAPENLRAAGEAISLGFAPNPGAQRSIDRAEIVRSLRDAPALSQALEIPPSVEVTRWSRRLTGAEVIAAIRRALMANQFNGAASVGLEELAFDSPIRVTEENPQLRVTRIEAAPDGAAIHVRMWTSSEPRTPPFWVMLRRDLDKLAPACSARSECPDPNAGKFEGSTRIHDGSAAPPKPGTARTPTPTASDPSVLIRRGQRVQLVVEVNGMRIMATAVPLDLGRRGEKIRVRNVDSGKVLVGTVVSAQTVEVQF